MKYKNNSFFILLSILIFISCCASQTRNNIPQQKNLDKDLFEAIENNDENKVKTLLEQGANPNTRKSKDYSAYINTPLHAAMYRNNSVIVELLLKHGANLSEAFDKCHKNEKNCYVWIPLEYSAWKGDLETSKVLVKYGAEVNDNLIHQAKLSHKMVKFLVDNGVDINYREGGKKNGLTALMNAAQWGNFGDRLVPLKALIDNGADPFLKDENGHSALVYADYHRFDREGAKKIIREAMKKHRRLNKEKRKKN